jgi:hypothetical protein
MLRHVVYASLLHFGVETAQIFKDPALTPRQWQRNSLELGISAIKKDAQLANLGGVALALVPAPDGTHPGQYFTNMDRFANNVIDACRK